ncbi:MAG: hypothetical protein RLP08_24975 [Marinovum algicola]|jgi:hypothetical protein|uniref:hypothetical protein n=1 Tax=Marinovum algicola TaxID=42444 RepID=UPI0032EFFF1C
MFKTFRPDRASPQDLVRVESEVRKLYAVTERELVLVSQDTRGVPGLPPLETNVVFWKAGRRYRVKIFKPLAEVAASDFPTRWLLPAFEDNGDIDCC